jgi:hypothetical protein
MANKTVFYPQRTATHDREFIHASIVYFGGGTFTRPLIHKLVVNRDSPRIRVTSFPEIRLSLKWWKLHRGERPITEHLRSPIHQLWSDASSTKGLGAFYKTEGFCIAWNSWDPWYLKQDEASKMHINILELLAVVLSCVIWGERWNTAHVLIHCDNSSVCNVITAKRSTADAITLRPNPLWFCDNNTVHQHKR